MACLICSSDKTGLDPSSYRSVNFNWLLYLSSEHTSPKHLKRMFIAMIIPTEQIVRGTGTESRGILVPKFKGK